MEEYTKAKFSIVSDNPRNSVKLTEQKETWQQIVLGVFEFSTLFCVGVMFLYFFMMSVRG